MRRRNVSLYDAREIGLEILDDQKSPVAYIVSVRWDRRAQRRWRRFHRFMRALKRNEAWALEKRGFSASEIHEIQTRGRVSFGRPRVSIVVDNRASPAIAKVRGELEALSSKLEFKDDGTLLTIQGNFYPEAE